MVTASVIELRLSFIRAVTGAKLPIANGTNRPIVLKKSVSVSTAEKFAPELEICVLGRRFMARTSRGCTQNRSFFLSVSERFGQTGFFNTIGQNRAFEGPTKARLSPFAYNRSSIHRRR